MHEMTMHSVEYIWDMFDLDSSGEIDEEEFHNLLVHLNVDEPEHIHPDNAHMRLEIMRDLKAVKRHHAHHRHKHKLVLLRRRCENEQHNSTSEEDFEKKKVVLCDISTYQ